MKNTRRASMSRTNGDNCVLVLVSVDVSRKEQGNHKSVISLLTQKKPTDDLTATSNSDYKSVHTDDDELDYLLTWNLSTTDDE